MSVFSLSRVFTYANYSVICRTASSTARTSPEHNLGFLVAGEDEGEWQSEAEGEAPPPSHRGGDGGGEVSGDVASNDTKTSPRPGQEGESPRPTPPRLRLKAGLATDPALRASVASPLLPPSAPGLEYLAALNPAYHSGETERRRALAAPDGAIACDLLFQIYNKDTAAHALEHHGMKIRG